MKRILSIATQLCLVVVLLLGLFGKTIVDKTEYDRVSEGMSYSEVVSVIGKEGTELSSGTIKGVSGFMPSITTKMYSWQNSDGSNMNAMFQNDKLINKAQFGLKAKSRT